MDENIIESGLITSNEIIEHVRRLPYDEFIELQNFLSNESEIKRFLNEDLFKSTSQQSSGINTSTMDRLCIGSTIPYVDNVDDTLYDGNDHDVVPYDEIAQESANYAGADPTDNISNLIADSPLVQPRHAEESATNSQYKPYSKILPHQNASLIKTNETKPNQIQYEGYEKVHGAQLSVRSDISREHRGCRISDMKESIRYFNSNSTDKGITLSISPAIFCATGKLWLRITRLCVVNNSADNIIHPYPIWINDANAFTYNQSLFVSVDQEAKLGGDIKIPKLVLVKSLDNEALKTPEFYKYADRSGEMEVYTKSKNKNPVLHGEPCDLSFSKLRFEIVLIESDNKATATDLVCETPAIQETDRRSGKKKECETLGRPQPQNQLLKRLTTRNSTINRRKHE